MHTQLYREVSNATADHPRVGGQNALALANIISFDCELENSKCPEAKELINLLSSPHIEVRILFMLYSVTCMFSIGIDSCQ